ncbi:hypothetical protein VIBNISFn118_2350008 [Vibrio nigripulchritudo SFn118]|nr:hypothetical protein VIBNISFn118_2350008 [Vibrio nigripulchritudo SFn118]
MGGYWQRQFQKSNKITYTAYGTVINDLLHMKIHFTLNTHPY